MSRPRHTCFAQASHAPPSPPPLLQGDFMPFRSRRLTFDSLMTSVTLACVGAAPAAGQEQEVTQPDTTGEDIVVTGTALQNREAIAERRGSSTIVDTLIQDDTGDLADQSLSEALARVPGVSTMQVLYGEQESQYVAVRGITPDLNYVS